MTKPLQGHILERKRTLQICDACACAYVCCARVGHCRECLVLLPPDARSPYCGPGNQHVSSQNFSPYPSSPHLLLAAPTFTSSCSPPPYLLCSLAFLTAPEHLHPPHHVAFQSGVTASVSRLRDSLNSSSNPEARFVLIFSGWQSLLFPVS